MSLFEGMMLGMVVFWFAVIFHALIFPKPNPVKPVKRKRKPIKKVKKVRKKRGMDCVRCGYRGAGKFTHCPRCGRLVIKERR